MMIPKDKFSLSQVAGDRLSDFIGNPCTDNNQNYEDDYMICGYKGFGFLNVDMTNNGKTLSANFFSNDNNTIIDQFTIDK